MELNYWVDEDDDDDDEKQSKYVTSSKPLDIYVLFENISNYILLLCISSRELEERERDDGSTIKWKRKIISRRNLILMPHGKAIRLELIKFQQKKKRCIEDEEEDDGDKVPK